MDGSREDYMKWTKSHRERQIPCDIIYMWNPKYDTNQLIYEIETDSDSENKFMLTKGNRGRDKLGVWN